MVGSARSEVFAIGPDEDLPDDCSEEDCSEEDGFEEDGFEEDGFEEDCPATELSDRNGLRADVDAEPVPPTTPLPAS